jgi:hypothetical protein
MATRRIGNTWFDSAEPFNEFLSAPNAYYSVDGGGDVLIEAVSVTPYQTIPDPDTGETRTLYQGSYNGTIPAGAEGSNVVLKIYDPNNLNDILEFTAIDVCTDVATSVMVSPAEGVVDKLGTIQFEAIFYAADGLTTENHDAVVWSTDASGPTEGDIDTDTGLFTAGTENGGPYTVTTTAGALSDDGTVTVMDIVASMVSLTCSSWMGM